MPGLPFLQHGYQLWKLRPGTAAFTANPSSPCREEIVGSRILGRTAITCSKSEVATFSSTMTRRRASKTDSKPRTKDSIAAFFSGAPIASRLA